VALAVASAAKRVALTGHRSDGPAPDPSLRPGPLACFGELGLTGELRTVGHADRRLTEAQRFGLAPVLHPEVHKTLRGALSAALAPAQEVVRAA
jgi:DNA repair protein RadA/Sms